MQSGSQVTFQQHQWTFSPTVFNLQGVVLVRNAGLPDFLLTAGGGVALNNTDNTTGVTGQGFLQMGLAGFNFAQFGRFDLFNPFFQMMVAGTTGQPAQFGMALGNSFNFSLIKSQKEPDQDVLQLNLNGQLITACGLNNGVCLAPGGQGLLGLTLSAF
jgi:hypothetical protein